MNPVAGPDDFLCFEEVLGTETLVGQSNMILPFQGQRRAIGIDGLTALCRGDAAFGLPGLAAS
jgi:hypothetical protein